MAAATANKAAVLQDAAASASMNAMGKTTAAQAPTLTRQRWKTLPLVGFTLTLQHALHSWVRRCEWLKDLGRWMG